MGNSLTLQKSYTALLALQTLTNQGTGAAAGIVQSSVIDLRGSSATAIGSGKLSAVIAAHVGRTAVTAFTANTGVRMLIEGAYISQNGATPTDATEWFPLVGVKDTGPLAACNTNALTVSGGAIGSGQPGGALTLSANAAIDYSLASELLYFRNATIANGEFHRCTYASTGGTSLCIEDNLVRTQNSDNLYDGATEWLVPLDLSGVQYLRVTILNNTGVSVDVECYMVACDLVAVN